MRRRLWAAAFGLAMLAVVALLVGDGLGREPVLNPAGWGAWHRFWGAALRPDLSPEQLAVTVRAAATTVAFATLGTALAVAIGLVGGVLLSAAWWRADPLDGRRRRLARRLALGTGRVGVAVPRGVHETVWGLLLLMVLGRDPLVGVLAIAVPFGAITATVYAGLIDETVDAPERALRGAGAGTLVRTAYGVLPLVRTEFIAYGCYRLDCALRSAVILGMVGAGGLGFEFLMAFGALDYPRLWTLIYALVLLGAVVDAWSRSLRGEPSARWVRASVALAGLLVAWSVATLGVDGDRLLSRRTLDLAGDLVLRSWPPQTPAEGAAQLARAAAETLGMSVLAIVLASALGLLAALVAARRPGQGALRRAVGAAARLALLATRAVSVPVWALVVLFVVLPGVLPGAIALGIYTAGVLGRLFAETLENADPRPAQALRAAGAGGVATFAYGVLPLVAPKLLGYALYRWEVAIRDTVVVGVVGAGGLGRILEERRVAFDLPGMLGVVLVLLALAVLVDAISTAARRDLREA